MIEWIFFNTDLVQNNTQHSVNQSLLHQLPSSTSLSLNPMHFYSFYPKQTLLSFNSMNCSYLIVFSFQLDEQVKYLKKNVVHLGIGTPNRILKLIEEGTCYFLFSTRASGSNRMS